MKPDTKAIRARAGVCEPNQSRADVRALLDRVEALETALRRGLDGCFCDDRDGNCNPPHNEYCDWCEMALAALDGTDPAQKSNPMAPAAPDSNERPKGGVR